MVGGDLTLYLYIKTCCQPFLNEKYFPVNRLNLTLERSVSLIFVSFALARQSFLNIEMMSFLILSSIGPLLPLTLARS